MNEKIMAICPECGSDKISGYEESETEFCLTCVICGTTEIKNMEKENRPIKLFPDWFMVDI